jgi:hypothetical protein
MPPDLMLDQPALPDAPAGATLAGDALAALAQPVLDPLFQPSARSGVASAWHGHVPFAQWLVAAARPELIVELGTHNGVSYAAFCETVLRERLATRCYAVDSWTGDAHAGEYDESVYTALRDFHDGRYGAFSELLRMSFDAARGVIADGSVDLLHIDGFHGYEAVRHDFTSWEAKLSPRAVVLFHDTNVLERGFGVVRFWAEIRDRYPSFEFLHGHGLGVLAVGPAVPPAVARLCATPSGAATALLRDRFAALGRPHQLDCALRETTRQEQRLRAEADARDGVVESLRRSLEEVLRHRDDLLAEQQQEQQRRAVQEAAAAAAQAAEQRRTAALEAATVALRQALADSQDQAARLEAAGLDDRRRLAQQAQSAAERGERLAETESALAARDSELRRLQRETEVLRGHLTAARADVTTAREDGRAQLARLQAVIDARESEMAALQASAGWRLTAPLRGLGLLPSRP